MRVGPGGVSPPIESTSGGSRPPLAKIRMLVVGVASSVSVRRGYLAAFLNTMSTTIPSVDLKSFGRLVASSAS